MEFTIGSKYLEVLAFVLLALVLAAAIFFWGRGIRRSRRSDLIAGPAILVALCLILFAIVGSSELSGMMVMAFGVATLLLSPMARPSSKLKRRDVLAIGTGAIIAGFCLGMIL